MGKILKGEQGQWVDSTLWGVGAPGSIVSRERLLATDEAREILELAGAEALRIRQEAERLLIEAVREKEAERARGLAEGRETGLAEVTERLAAIEIERERLLAGQEKEIVAMVLEIAQKVVARELKKKAVVDIVRQALRQAVGGRVVVKLNPSDKSKVAKEALDETRTVVLEEDESIRAGGCVVETELGSVDARLETQWEAIRKALGLENGESK